MASALDILCKPLHIQECGTKVVGTRSLLWSATTLPCESNKGTMQRFCLLQGCDDGLGFRYNRSGFGKLGCEHPDFCWKVIQIERDNRFFAKNGEEGICNSGLILFCMIEHLIGFESFQSFLGEFGIGFQVAGPTAAYDDC